MDVQDETVALTFVIPVRHPSNCPDWAALVSRLRQTVASVEAQKSPSWRAVIVVNSGAHIPEFSERVSVVRVDFAPNAHFEKAGDLDRFRDSVRRDKGYRVLHGMRAAGPTNYFMVVDDDDFVSSKLVNFVSENLGAAGWRVENGLVWSEGSRFVLVYSDFYNFCGTSLIVRSDLYRLNRWEESEPDPRWVSEMLGSHVLIAPHLEAEKTPLQPLPFLGAVYRVGHKGAHSQSYSVALRFLLNPRILRRSPRELVRHWRNMRRLTPELRAQFEMPTTSSRA